MAFNNGTSPTGTVVSTEVYQGVIKFLVYSSGLLEYITGFLFDRKGAHTNRDTRRKTQTTQALTHNYDLLKR